MHNSRIVRSYWLALRIGNVHMRFLAFLHPLGLENEMDSDLNSKGQDQQDHKYHMLSGHTSVSESLDLPAPRADVIVHVSGTHISRNTPYFQRASRCFHLSHEDLYGFIQPAAVDLLEVVLLKQASDPLEHHFYLHSINLS